MEAFIDEVTGERRTKSTAPAAQAQEAPDIAKLEGMTREDLIALVERMARQCGMVASMTEDEIRQAFLDRMAHIGLTGKAQEALAAMEKRMDRVEGKAIQREAIAIKVENVPVDEQRLMKLINFMIERGKVIEHEK